MVRESAQAINGDAAFALSLLYLDGRGVTRNTVDELKWLDRAIELDHPPAMLQRGGLHARDGQPGRQFGSTGWQPRRGMPGRRPTSDGILPTGTVLHLTWPKR
jgi:TPR repeat protein